MKKESEATDDKIKEIERDKDKEPLEPVGGFQPAGVRGGHQPAGDREGGWGTGSDSRSGG